MRKAPDKIYRNTDKTGYVCWSETEFVKPYSATAYIRKDALLEWAKDTEKSRMRVPIEAYNNEDYQAGFIDGFAKFRRILIDKINSL